MEAISLLVHDQPGVMQRVMGIFTRRRINVETIVVGKCEQPGQARIVLTVAEPRQVQVVIEHLRRQQDIIEATAVSPERHEAYALIAEERGATRLTGSIEEVWSIIEKTKPTRYIVTINAL